MAGSRMIRSLEGPGYIHLWDQGLAEARASLRNCAAFVIVTVNADTRQTEFHALSRDFGPEGMASLLDVTAEACIASIAEIETETGA